MKKNMNRRAILIVLLIALLLIGAVGGTVAYLMTQTSEVKNVFQPAGVPSEVEEDTFDGETKKNVVIRNNGNVPAYIRAAIVVTWKDGEGKIAPVVPVKGTDYTIDINTTDWTEADGFYYHKKAVPAEETTEKLINSCSMKAGAVPPAGYSLNVEIIGQAIQAEGMDAANAQDAWAKAVTTP